MQFNQRTITIWTVVIGILAVFGLVAGTTQIVNGSPGWGTWYLISGALQGVSFGLLLAGRYSAGAKWAIGAGVLSPPLGAVAAVGGFLIREALRQLDRTDQD
jgi:hypothetical protein